MLGTQFSINKYNKFPMKARTKNDKPWRGTYAGTIGPQKISIKERIKNKKVEVKN